MLFVAAWIAFAPPALPATANADAAIAAREAEALLPPAVAGAYLEAQAALRDGRDDEALAAWKRARAAWQALPSTQRLDKDVKDAVVRYELRLAEIARVRFDRVRGAFASADTPALVQQKLVEKRRLFALLAGDGAALDADGFDGALRFVPSLNPALRGVHCQRAELTARYMRWMTELPCASELSDAECEAAKTRAAGEDSVWREAIAHAQAQCRASS